MRHPAVISSSILPLFCPMIFRAAGTTPQEPPCPNTVLTPAPAATPRLTGPKVFGVRPGSPFLSTLTATGERPMEFSARAFCVAKDAGTAVLSEELEDGSRAVGLFNLGGTAATVRVRWPDFGLNGVQQLRDLWRQQNSGKFDAEYTANFPAPGLFS